MLTKEELEYFLSKSLTTGATNADIYIEKKKVKIYKFEDNKLENILCGRNQGVGIRIYDKEHQVYASTSEVVTSNIEKLIDQLLPSFIIPTEIKPIKCIKRENRNLQDTKIKHEDYPVEKKKELLASVNKIIRDISPLVQQVEANLGETEKEIILANSEGYYVEHTLYSTRLSITVTVKRGDRLERLSSSGGLGGGYEFLENIDIKEFAESLTNSTLKKLDAIDAPSGELPVIIAPGFGAVIFHEACGHALEATSIAKKDSVFYDKKNQIIASPKVTLIDDATIVNEWGSMSFDDEGNIPQKNILIENGVLKNFLVDSYNGKRMDSSPNGCARRESYQFAPTSRMSNTYLARGTDKIEDMFASITYGIYCKKFTGGSVNPTTGNFNFTVSESYLIENGKITSPLKNISLIGNNQEILKRVEMISDDLKLDTGYCGSSSGSIFVTIGQPTIKVSSILIGGTK